MARGQWEVGNRAEDGGRKTVVGKQKNLERGTCTLHPVIVNR